MGFSDRICHKNNQSQMIPMLTAFCDVPPAAHLLRERGDVVVEGLRGADVAVAGHPREVRVGGEGGGVSRRAGG